MNITRISKRLRHHFLLRTLHFLAGVSTYFFLATLLSLSFYVLGNFQSFTEATQLLLLSLSQFISIVGIVTSLYYFIFLIYWGYTRGKMPAQRLIYAGCVFLLNSVFAIGVLLIQEFTRGLV